MMKERTNPKSVAPHKVKGTVLFTVVCVMMVLIVFLMGALALATTANKRAMKNYNEAQTQATARAGVHALMSAIQNDVNAAKAASELDGKTDKTTAIEFKEGDIVFESNMTWDADQKKYVGSNAGALGKIESAEIRYVGHKYILDSTGVLKDKAVIKFSATAKQGDAESTYAVYMLRDIDEDGGGGGGGGGGGFVSTGAAGASNHTSALGGTYIGFDKIDEVTKLPTHKTNFEPGNESIFEAPMHIYGNLKDVSRVGKVDFLVEPGTGLTVWGDINMSGQDGSGLNILTVNATKDKMKDKSYTEIPYIFSDGAITLKQGSSKIGDPDIPLNIFCKEFVHEKSWGKLNLYADLICFDADGNSILGHTNKDDVALYRWTANLMYPGDTTATEHYGGNVYSKGNVTIQCAGNNAGDGLSIDGKAVIEKNLTLEGLKSDGTPGYCLEIRNGNSLTVKGDITGAGKITFKPDSHGNYGKLYYAKTLPPSVTIEGGTLANAAGDSYPSYYEYDVITGDDKTTKIISTVSEIMDTKINPFNESMITEMSAKTDKGLLDANIAKITGNKDHAEAKIIKGSGFISASEPNIIITDSCTIYGEQKGGKLIFKPKDGKEIWVRIAGGAKGTEDPTSEVKTDDFSGGFKLDTCSIYLDDSEGGKVNLFLTSDMSYSGANGKTMWTKKLDEAFAGASNKGFEIYTDKNFSVNNTDYPNLSSIGISLYSDTNKHTLDMGDGNYTMAVNILAPYLILKHKPSAPSIYGYADNSDFKIYYNGLELHEKVGDYTGSVFSTAFTTKVGIIGCCVINQLESDNDWALLYVPQGTSNQQTKKKDLEDALLVGWQNLYYENY